MDKTKRGYAEKKHIISKFKLNEQVLTKQAKQLQSVVEMASKDVSQLQDVIVRRKNYDEKNEAACRQFDSNMNAHLNTMKGDLETFSNEFGTMTTTIIQQISECLLYFIFHQIYSPTLSFNLGRDVCSNISMIISFR